MLEYFFQIIETAPPGVAFAAVIFMLLVCGLGLPFPEDILLVLAGYLVYAGEVSMQTCLLFCFLAILVGDSMLFFIGYKFGNRIFKLPVFGKLMTPGRVKKVNDQFHKYGNRVVFVARFMAGVRGTVFLTAGILRMPFRRFILFDSLAALVSAPFWVYAGYYLAVKFGGAIDRAEKTVRRIGWLLFIVVAILMIAVSVFMMKKRKRQDRNSARGISSTDAA